MPSWDYERTERALAGLAGGRDPNDPRERTRRRILRAARELFTERGYRRATVGEVARAAGVAKGTVYLYFETKADLICHAALEEKLRYFEKLRPVLDGAMPPAERLRALIRTVLVLSTQMPLASRLIAGDQELQAVLEEMNPEFRDMADAIKTDFWADLLDAAAAPHGWTREELRDRANVLVGILFSGLCADAWMRGGLSTERYAGIVADMVVDGLGRPRGVGS